MELLSSERAKWAGLFAASIIFLLWIMFGTVSSGTVAEGDSVASQDQTQEAQADATDRQFQSSLGTEQSATQEQTGDTPTVSSGSISDYQVFLDIDGVWGDPIITEETGIKNYQFTHNDGSTLAIAISLNELNVTSADYKWTHTAAQVEDGYNIDFVIDDESNTVLCEAGSAGCSAGNGVLDILSTNQDTSAEVFVRVSIADTEQDIDTAENYYKNIIESIQVKRS